MPLVLNGDLPLVTTNNTSSQDFELAVYSGTTGTSIGKMGTLSGIVAVASGVARMAVGTDLPVMSSTLPGAVPTPPNDSKQSLLGDGTWGYTKLAQVVGPNTGTAYTLAANSTRYIVPVQTVASSTWNLPSSPLAGDKVYISNFNSSSTYQVTVGRNGNLINADTQDITLDVYKASVVFEYTGATYGWIIY